MKKRIVFFLNLLSILLLFSVGSVSAQSGATVNAVLFFSPTCPHCEQVVTYDLPPLQEKYGAALRILMIDVTSPEGQSLYQAAVTYYEIPDERLGVPTLIVDGQIMVGSGEIPSEFPALIEAGLAAGGVDFPPIPGLDVLLGTLDTTEIQPPVKMTMAERFALDPQGNTISVIVLLGMLVVLGMVAFNFTRHTPRRADAPIWLVPALTTLGMLVAIYLSFVEMTSSQAICGPVGDCNTVQQSPYATLFGILPVGVLGVIGYLLIFGTWMQQNLGRAEWRPMATKALWLFSGLGTLFSIYLTFLEPFVIGATCMWCITSAVAQTSIFWLSSDAAKAVFVPRFANHGKRKHSKTRPSKKHKRHA